MRNLVLVILLAAFPCLLNCGGDHKTLIEEPEFLPKEYLNDFFPVYQPLIIDEIPDYLLTELHYLGWDYKSPVYHKWDSTGTLIISLSKSLFIGRFGPLQRSIRFDEDGPVMDQDLYDLLHKLQVWGDSTSYVERTSLR